MELGYQDFNFISPLFFVFSVFLLGFQIFCYLVPQTHLSVFISQLSCLLPIITSIFPPDFFRGIRRFRSSPAVKLHDFCARSSELMDVMGNQGRIRKLLCSRVFNNGSAESAELVYRTRCDIFSRKYYVLFKS